jgi:hypothetical protein
MSLEASNVDEFPEPKFSKYAKQAMSQFQHGIDINETQTLALIGICEHLASIAIILDKWVTTELNKD